MKSRISLLVAFAVFAAFSVSAAFAEDKKVADDTHKGTFVSLSADKLTMTGSDGKDHSHMVAKDVKYTVDGKDAKASDFKSGMKIRVTTKTVEGKNWATLLEGLDKNADFGT